MILLMIAAGSLAAAVFLTAVLVLHAVFGRTRVQQRLYQLRRFSSDRRTAAQRFGDEIGVTALRIAKVLSHGGEARTQALLERAAVRYSPAEWLLIRAGIAVLGGILLGGLLGWFGLPVGLLTGALVPNMLLRSRVERRKRAFANDLPETLQLAVSSLRSGFTLQHAIEAAANDGEGPVADELRRAISETRLGGHLEDALERVADRTGNRDVSWLVMAIRIHREVGGNLSEVLQTTTDTMRERAGMYRHVRALAAEGKLSGYILFGMPLMIGAWLLTFRSAYVKPLYTQPLGIAMLVYAVLSLIAGALWLRAVVKIEV